MARLENRSLDRGIAILEALAGRGACTLADLHDQTGLAKSTLRRLLATLTRRGIVRRSLGDQRYRINVSLPLINSAELSPRTARIVEIAVPHMIELTRRVEWPCDLHIRHGNRMRIVETTRTLSPFQLGRPTLDLEVNMFGAASGRAYLATFSDEEVCWTVRAARAHPRWGLRPLRMDMHTFLADLAAVRAAGYAGRSPRYRGETPRFDSLKAMAVALFAGGAAAGALVVVWPQAYLDARCFAELHLGATRAAARQISAELADLDGAGLP